jgi:biopolymer transport protein ExbB
VSPLKPTVEQTGRADNGAGRLRRGWAAALHSFALLAATAVAASAADAVAPTATAVTAAATATAPAADAAKDFDVAGQIFSWGMTPLWICSFVLIAMIIERLRTLRPERVLDQTMADEVAALVGQNKLVEAQARADSSGTVAGKAWAQGLHEFSLGGVPFAEALTNATVLAFKPLKRNLQGIATIGVICPLFGLLGTIIGMIITFTHISAAGGANKAAIAGGIAFALVKTAGGLVVAIPAIVAGRYFQGRLAAFAVQAEAAINRINYRHNHALAQARAGVLSEGTGAAQATESASAQKDVSPSDAAIPAVAARI